MKIQNHDSYQGFGFVTVVVKCTVMLITNTHLSHYTMFCIEIHNLI